MEASAYKNMEDNKQHRKTWYQMSKKPGGVGGSVGGVGATGTGTGTGAEAEAEAGEEALAIDLTRLKLSNAKLVCKEVCVVCHCTVAVWLR